MTMPEYVKHIADTHYDRIGLALCGRKVGFAKETPNPDPLGKPVRTFVETEFCFANVDHWLNNARNGGRLLGCAKCVAVIERMVAWNKSERAGEATK